MDGYNRNIFSLPNPSHHIRISRAFATLVRPIVRNTGCDPLFFTTPVRATQCFLQHLQFCQNLTDYMEARARISILDFENLFSDFQELLNKSGLSPGVKDSLGTPRSDWAFPVKLR